MRRVVCGVEAHVVVDHLHVCPVVEGGGNRGCGERSHAQRVWVIGGVVSKWQERFQASESKKKGKKRKKKGKVSRVVAVDRGVCG